MMTRLSFLLRLSILCLCATLATIASVGTCFANDDFQGATHMMPFEEDTIAYGERQDTSLIARLQEAIDAGEITLDFKHDGQGYLLSLLDQLNIPTESQLLVFSKTSFQRHKISPSTPRARFFCLKKKKGFF
jgi:hypothetical protein